MDSVESSSSYRDGAEHGQTWLIERQQSLHRDLVRSGASPSPPGTLASTSRSHPHHTHGVVPPLDPTPLLRRNVNSTGSSMKSMGSYGSMGTLNNNNLSLSNASPPTSIRSIRFQVVIWNMGKLDVVAGTVPMTFRVSLFWNCVEEDDINNNDDEETMTQDGAASVQSIHVWKMQGRQRAFQQEVKDVPTMAIEVPPLSVMNVSTFHVIGSPEVGMLNEQTHLMRWTCMYRAEVIQENLRVDQFPHDSHDIHLKLAILSHRGKGKIWDRRYWKLDLATVDDTQHTTRIPHGLIVDQVNIPGFRHNRERGLNFQFCPLDHGLFDQHAPGETTDQYLKVSLNILRESGYYDNNIVPILALMNVVAISVLTFDDTEFFYRALITLNIAFVQMGMRMTADNHLPMVEYEIRLQRILNEFFVVLMMLVLEANLVYVLTTYHDVPRRGTKALDWITGTLAILHNIRLTFRYYNSKHMAKLRLERGWKSEDGKRV